MGPHSRRADPARPPRPGRSALGLLDQACRGLHEAALSPHPPDRYATAHLAALRAAAAVLAVRVEPESAKLRRRRPTSAWVLLTSAAPELGEWAAFFAAGAAKRAAAEADLPASVTADEADQLVRDVSAFIGVVETTLGLAPHLGIPALPARRTAQGHGLAPVVACRR